MVSADTFDSDGDGIDDNSDNCTLAFNPGQEDADRDFMGNMCDGDFDNNGVINFLDLSVMRASFLTNDSVVDLNSDGTVNFLDLQRMSELFFGPPGPTATDPARPPCTCYFSGDCPSGSFCNYGPGSFTTEDICVWRDVKPDGVVGAGCYIESDLDTGAWVPDICDGVCSAAVNGSNIGFEDASLLAQTILVWGDAMIDPSAAGGGPVDADLAAQANAVQFDAINVPMMLGRQTADALAMAAGEPFHLYFCHFEVYPEDENPPVVNLAGNTCLVTSAELTVQALAAEIQNPGSAAAIMNQIPDACPDWQQMFGTQCEPGPGALTCAVQFIEAQAYFLSTPALQPSAAADPVNLLIGSTPR